MKSLGDILRNKGHPSGQVQIRDVSPYYFEIFLIFLISHSNFPNFAQEAYIH